jgi:nucleotide-binding universal stress UspA family protein
MIAPMGMIHQAPVTFGGEGDLLGEAVEDSEKRLKALRDELFSDVDCATKVAVAATASAGVLEQAEAFKPDLIVVSSHGRSAVMHLLIGSTTEKVVRHAPCEVLVVK